MTLFSLHSASRPPLHNSQPATNERCDRVNTPDTATAIDSWTKGQRICRGRQRHNWNALTVVIHRSVFEVIERCSHCANRRHRHMDKDSGYWLDRWDILYRDNYLLPKGAGRIDDDTQAWLRLTEVLTRKMEVAPDE